MPAEARLDREADPKLRRRRLGNTFLRGGSLRRRHTARCADCGIERLQRRDPVGEAPTSASMPPPPAHLPDSVGASQFDVTLGGEINNEPKRFTVFYHCRLPGEATISATLPIDDYIPLRWSWTKLCSNELASHVNVGTSSRSTDVVLEGVPAEAWNASLASASLGPMESRHEFFVSVTKGQAFYAVDVDVEPTLALVQVEGDFDPASGGEVPADLVHDTPVVHVPGNQEKVLRLSVSCQASGEAQVGVHLKPYALYDACVGWGRGGVGCLRATAHSRCSFRPIMFGFRLRCGGVPRQRLLVATTVLREGINPLDANVASDGSLLVSWGELTYVADPQERCVARVAPRGCWGPTHSRAPRPGCPAAPPNRRPQDRSLQVRAGAEARRGRRVHSRDAENAGPGASRGR